MFRFWLRFGFIVLLLACLVGKVRAHDVVLLRSVPMDGAWLDQSPNEVTLWFGEELVSDSSHFTLFNSRGEALNSSGVDLHDPDHASMTAASPPLTTGIYTVYWQVSLLDGDQTEGTIVFTVGQPDPRETAFYPAAATTTNQSARTAVFAIIALIIIIGGSIFWQRRTR